MDNPRIKLRTYNDDHHSAYVELADHPHALVSGIVKKTVRLQDLMPDYKGPGIAIDFNEQGTAIGIEILYPYGDSDD